MASKKDVAQIAAVCRILGMSELERYEFGLYVEERKRSGERGSLNDRGDYTFAELIEIGTEFMDATRSDG